MDGKKLVLPGNAAALLGVCTRMLEYYEKKGTLIPAVRFGGNGHWGLRLYHEEDVQRLARQRKADKKTVAAGVSK